MPFYVTEFKDLFYFEPEVFEDCRGYFFESFNLRKFQEETNLRVNFVQDNQSKSAYGALRGLHFQRGDDAQAKLVRVLSGKVLDVVVDLRPDSANFKKSFTIELSSKNKRQLFIPRGFAHGFIVLSDFAEFFYKCDNYYNSKSEGGIYFADKELNIDWKVPADKLVLSDKDRNLPSLAELFKL